MNARGNFFFITPISYFYCLKHDIHVSQRKIIYILHIAFRFSHLLATFNPLLIVWALFARPGLTIVTILWQLILRPSICTVIHVTVNITMI